MRHLLLISTLFLPVSAIAAPVCDVPTGWTKPVAHRAAATPEMRFALKSSDVVDLTLLPSNKVKLAAVSARKPKAGARFAGLAAVDFKRAGTVTIILSDKAYVDLVRSGTALTSTAHRDPGCGGVAKTVSFAVTPGRYILQFTDAPAAKLKMAIVSG